MPISLGPSTTNPKWSKGLLLLLWIIQFCVTGLFELITFFIVFLFGSQGGHKHVRWYFTASMIYIFIANIIVLTTILYEFSWASRLAQLTAKRFYRIQLVKSAYFLTLVVMTLISGSGIPMPERSTGLAYVLSMCWRLAIFVAPFWTALAYAVVMRRKQVREFEEEEERGTLLKMLW